MLCSSCDSGQTVKCCKHSTRRVHVGVRDGWHTLADSSDSSDSSDNCVLRAGGLWAAAPLQGQRSGNGARSARQRLRACAVADRALPGL